MIKRNPHLRPLDHPEMPRHRSGTAFGTTRLHHIDSDETPCSLCNASHSQIHPVVTHFALGFPTAQLAILIARDCFLRGVSYAKGPNLTRS